MQSSSMAYIMKPGSQEELEVASEQLRRKGWCLRGINSYFTSWRRNYRTLQVHLLSCLFYVDSSDSNHSVKLLS